MEILEDFIFVICVFVGGGASTPRFTPSASQSLGLLLRALGGFGAINVEKNTRLAKKG